MNATTNDNLINEILDGGTIEQPWTEWTVRAEADPVLWRQLAEAQRDQLALMRAVGSACAVAEESRASAAYSNSTNGDAAAFGNVNFSGRAWLGWAVAAAVVIVAGLAQLRTSNFQSTHTQPVEAMTAGWTPEQFFQQYMQQGQEQGSVIRELPQRVLINARPSDSGIGFDVVFLRQIQERATVPDLYEVTGQDDSGQARLVGYEPPRGGAM